MPDSNRTPATTALRTAVVGYGISGRVFHAPLIAADPAYSLDAIVTSDPQRARALAPATRTPGSFPPRRTCSPWPMIWTWWSWEPHRKPISTLPLRPSPPDSTLWWTSRS